MARENPIKPCALTAQPRERLTVEGSPVKESTTGLDWTVGRVLACACSCCCAMISISSIITIIIEECFSRQQHHYDHDHRPDQQHHVNLDRHTTYSSSSSSSTTSLPLPGAFPRRKALQARWADGRGALGQARGFCYLTRAGLTGWRGGKNEERGREDEERERDEKTTESGSGNWDN
jgi:hypothetical protein